MTGTDLGVLVLDEDHAVAKGEVRLDFVGATTEGTWSGRYKLDAGLVHQDGRWRFSRFDLEGTIRP